MARDAAEKQRLPARKKKRAPERLEEGKEPSGRGSTVMTHLKRCFNTKKKKKRTNPSGTVSRLCGPNPRGGGRRQDTGEAEEERSRTCQRKGRSPLQEGGRPPKCGEGELNVSFAGGEKEKRYLLVGGKRVSIGKEGKGVQSLAKEGALGLAREPIVPRASKIARREGAIW